jgi:branched-chain amino acid transport system substrate-binding protein
VPDPSIKLYKVLFKSLAVPVALSVAVVITLTSCTSPQIDADEVVIGVLASSFGPDAASREDALRGAQLAVEVVNSDLPVPLPLGPGVGLPGLNGAKVTLASEDPQSQSDQAGRLAAELVSQDHAVGIVLADPADIAASAGTELQRLRIPMVDAANSADYLTELGMDWYFRLNPSDRVLAESTFSLLQREHTMPGARIAILAQAGRDGAAVSAVISDVAARTGYAIAINEVMGFDDAAVSEVSGRLKASPAVITVAWAHDDQGAAAIARAAEGYPLIGFGKGFAMLPSPPDSSQMILRSVPWSAELAKRTPAAQAIAELYRQRYGVEMSSTAAAAFTAALTLSMAVNESGSRDAGAVRAALRQTAVAPTELIMPWNGLRFAGDGHNSLAAGVTEQWDGAAFKVVHPAELASTPLRWQLGAGA